MSRCLILGVMDDASIIIDYLDNDKHRFDSMYIIDYYSIDGTIPLIKQWCYNNNKLYQIRRSDKLISGSEHIRLARLSYPNAKIIAIDW